MSNFFSNTGQPEAAARQAFAPVLSFLPSFNEVQQRPILAIDVAIDSKPAGECDCVRKNVNKDRKCKQTAMSSVNKHIVHVKKVTLLEIIFRSLYFFWSFRRSNSFRTF